jgi:amidohydrolase
MTDLNPRIDANVRREADALLELSHRIHAHPEILFEEFQASAWLADALEARGFAVERGVGGLPTAFRAVREGAAPGPTVALLCEYDALPGMGHACGHNVIATMGAGAGFALAPLMDELPGRLVVLGTPAEEGGGGKVLLQQAGVFDGVDAALMIHPWLADQAAMPLLASTRWDVVYHGRPAHAALAPHLGVNALDAVRLAFAGIDALRQQVRPDVRIHGIVTHGGDAPNVIPERAGLKLVARSADGAYLLEELAPRIERLFEGAAMMTGARAEVTPAPIQYREMRFNRPLEAAFERHAARRGRATLPVDPLAATGSSDIGNVSQALPSLHGLLAIDDAAMPHTAAFEVAAGSPRGDATVLDGAAVLAGIAAELLTDPARMAEVRSAFGAAD